MGGNVVFALVDELEVFQELRDKSSPSTLTPILARMKV